jgi:hypothetical protein
MKVRCRRLLQLQGVCYLSNFMRLYADWVPRIGEFLHSRSFQGLEQRLGKDEPAVLEQGRSGIAKGYEDVDHPSIP